MHVRKTIGRVLGEVTAPLAFLGGFIRGERVFHPSGVVYGADVTPLAEHGALGRLAKQLSGVAVVRLSGGIWSWPASGHRPDVLGVAVGFHIPGEPLRPTNGHQDLLLVTARSLLTLPIAPFTTNVRDFLSNQYYAILPFALEGVGEVKFRLSPVASAPPGGNRRQRLVRALEEGRAVFRLEVQAVGRGEAWQPLAAIHLREELHLQRGALNFQPGNPPGGLVLRGVIQWIRPGAYSASQAGRHLARRLHR